MHNKSIKISLILMVFIVLSSFVYSADPLTDDILAYYTLDADGEDLNGTSNGTINGATFNTTGKFNGAYSFDGNDYIDLGRNGTLPEADGTPNTVSAWFYSGTDNGASDATIVTSRGTRQHSLLIHRNDYFGTTEVHCGAWVYTDTATITNNASWNHFVAVNDGVDNYIYMNGVRYLGEQNACVSITAVSEDSFIGMGSGSGNPFVGMIDEVGFWSSALNKSNVTWLYENGNPIISATPFECTGTANTPSISNCCELQLMNESLGSDYILLNDIDCSNTSSWHSGAGFVPMGKFTGTLYGQGYSITDLTINRPALNVCGLFTTYDSNTAVGLANFSLIDVNVTGGTQTGIIAGFNEDGSIFKNLTITGHLNANSNSGGVIGQVIKDLTIEDSNINITVNRLAGTGFGCVAGLTGATVSIYRTGIDCELNGAGSSGNGGIVGTALRNISIEESYVRGHIKGVNTAGGFVGTAPTINMSVVDSYTHVNISGSGTQCGGFVGSLSGNLTINRSYTVTNATCGNWMGGFIGTATNNQTVVITDSFAVPIDKTGVTVSGGISTYFSELNNVYWVNDSTYKPNVCYNHGSDGCTIVSKEYLYSTSSAEPFASWDFNNVWDITDDYPSLKYEDRGINVISLRFINRSGSNKTLFDEGEEFRISINYTDPSGNIIDNTTASCNITLLNGLVEVDSEINNFSVCGVGCNFSSYSELFTFDLVGAPKEDKIDIYVCNEQLQQQSIDLWLNCTGASYTEEITSIPLCVDSQAFLQVNTSVCIGQTELNITVIYDGTYNRRKRINDLAVDREYERQLNTYPADIYYNDSNGLFKTIHNHEYYKNGRAKIEVNCSDGVLITDYTENITIVNTPPAIDIGQLNYSGGVIDLNSTNNISYFSGDWQFFTSVNDDDLNYINYTIYNGSGSVLLHTSVSSPKIITTENEFFQNQSNFYNLTVWANDTNGDASQESILFYVHDLIPPDIFNVTPASESNILNNGSLYLQYSLIDDRELLRHNVTIYPSSDPMNILYNISENISGNSYFYSDTVSTVSWFNTSYTMEIYACDPHTAQIIDKANGIINDTDYIKYQFSDTVLEIISLDSEVKATKTIKKDDRYTFDFSYDTKIGIKTYFITSNKPIQYLADSEYKGHFIIGSSHWLDFQQEGDVIVNNGNYDKKDGYYVYVYNNAKDIEFKSIGELNCETVTTEFKLRPDASYDTSLISSTNWFNFGAFDTGTTAGVLLYFFLFILIVGLIAFGEITEIPALYMFAGLLTLFFAFLIFVSVSSVFGVVIGIVGGLLFMRSIIILR